MTDQQINQIMVRAKRGAFLSALLSVRLSWLAGAFAFITMITAISSQQLVISVITFCALCFAAIKAAFNKLNRFGIDEKVYFWSFLKNKWTQGEPPTRATQKLIDKVIVIYSSRSGNELFPLRQSVKLIGAYQHQQQQLHAVESRLSKINAKRQSLREKLAQLQRLGEEHDKAKQLLRGIEGDYRALDAIQKQIQASCDRLELILNSVEKAVQLRHVRRELDALSAAAPARAEKIEPAFAAESLEDIERQIGREIETYLQLERETEEHLR